MHDALHAPRYTIPEAARIVGLHPARVRRWLGVADAPATVVRQAGAPRQHVSFLDLIELDMVHSLVRDGFKLGRLRDAVYDAAQRLGVDHPLAQRSFLCDGRRLFLDDGEAMITLGHGGQIAFERIIRERAAVVEFAENGVARRWWPMGRDKVIVVDPELAWGEPSVAGTRWTTHAITQAVKGENGDLDRAARIHALDVEDVRRALEFEALHAA